MAILNRWRVVMLASFIFTTGIVHATENPSAKSLIAQLSNLNSISTQFTQTVTNTQAGSKEITTGNIVLQGHKLFRLEYLTPYKQTYVADGEFMWFYDEDLEQVTVKRQQDGLNDTPAMILSQPAKFIKQYQVSMLEEDVGDIYTLFSRSDQSAFVKINLRFKNNKLIEMIMFDNFGSRTQLKFSNMRYNIELPAKTFRFNPPKGVDVIQQYPETDAEADTDNSQYDTQN